MGENEFTTWLMNADTPSIRYRTLVDLFSLSADETRVTQARQAIMKSGPVPAILSDQSETGKWNGERSYYTPKYTSTHWSLMLLAELGVDGHDSRFQRGVHYMLNTTADELCQQLATGATGASCFWGNLLRYALLSDSIENARIEKLISFAAMALRDGPCRCRHNGGCACAWGAVRVLWGLAAFPKSHRSRETSAAIDQGVEFLLDSFSLVEANYPSNGKVNSLWFKLNFPLFYQVDILFTLRILDELDMLDHPGAQSALDWLEQRRDRNGRWKGSSPFRKRTWRELGKREETDRWVSFHAYRALQHAGRISSFES